MKLLVTGAGGQLGREILDALGGRHELVGVGRDRLDVTDSRQVMAQVRAVRPQAILHAAAYTKVDAAERETDAAYRVNAYGTRNVAAAAEAVGAKLAVVSTDYVFDGGRRAPYDEFERTAPLNVYGRSKLAGEQLAQACCRRTFVVRTAWLYGTHGENFVRRILAAAKRDGKLKAVTDETGSPTYARDLALFLDALVETDCYGIYHAAGGGACSRYEFVRAILEEAGLAGIEVEAVTADHFGLPARRPAYSALDGRAIRLNGLPGLRPWREALRDYLDREGGVRREL